MPSPIEDHPLNQASGATSTRSRPGRDTLFGALVVVIGVVLLVAGYIGVSGTTVASDQLSFMASGTLPGIAVLVAGAVLLGRASGVAQQREIEALRRQADALVAWLESASGDAASDEESPG